MPQIQIALRPKLAKLSGERKSPMIARRTLSQVLTIAGGIAMAAGAINPLGGALLILLGSGSLALGAYVGQCDRRWIAHRTAAFLLIAFGVAAGAALTSTGGFGGNSGRSMAWGVLVLPIFIGWSMGICGPGSPRWLLLSGGAVSLWYLAIASIVLAHPGRSVGPLPGLVLGATGLLTLGGCIARLTTRARRS